MQQAGGVARHEAVGVEEVLLQPEAREAPLQVAGAIAGDAMPQDQVLGPGRRADRVGLHEARPSRWRARSVVGGGSEPSTACRRSAAMVSLPAIRFSAPAQHFLHTLGRPAQAYAARSDHHRPLHQDRMRQDRVDQRIVGLGRIVQAEFVVRRAAPTQQLRAASCPSAAADRAVRPGSGGVFRYSTTRGSTPASRIMPSTLRDVSRPGCGRSPPRMVRAPSASSFIGEHRRAPFPKPGSSLSSADKPSNRGREHVRTPDAARAGRLPVRRPPPLRRTRRPPASAAPSPRWRARR